MAIQTDTFEYVGIPQDIITLTREILIQHGSIIEANCRLLRVLGMASAPLIKVPAVDEVMNNGK